MYQGGMDKPDSSNNERMVLSLSGRMGFHRRDKGTGEGVKVRKMSCPWEDNKQNIYSHCVGRPIPQYDRDKGLHY